MNAKKLLLSGTAAFLAAGAFSIGGVHAAETASGTTDVTYNNQEFVPGDSGVWGVVVPTAYTFTDGDETKTGKIELVGINSYKLDDFSDELKVQVSAKSTNGYQMTGATSGNTQTADYSVTYPKSGSMTADVTTNSGTGSVQVAELSKATPAVTATATLTNKPTVKDAYSDVITYELAHTGQELK